MKNGNSDLLKDFSAEQLAKLDGIIARFKGKPGGLIPVLEEAQVSLDYLPIPIQKRIAAGAESAAGAGLRRRHLLFLFHDEASRAPHGAGLPRHGLLRPRR